MLEERVCLESRRHGIVLLRPLGWAIAIALAGSVVLRHGWPLPVVGAAALGLSALIALRAVWRWERTHIVVTTEKLFVVHGTIRRRTAAVPLGSLGALELERTVLGRLLGYGTLVAGSLEVPYVPKPREVCSLVERLCH